MNWTYTLERMPSPKNDNKHIVRVTSKARKEGEDIRVKFFTNMDTHAVKVSRVQPIRLFAEVMMKLKELCMFLISNIFVQVKLKGVPVIDARVTAHIRALNQSGFLTPFIKIRLLDNGNGGE